MTTPIRKYAFINAKLRARISKLISENILQQMINAHSLDEALVILRDTPYRILDDIYRKTGDLKLGELELLKGEINLYIDIEKYIHGDTLDLVRALLTMYEIDKLKNAVRLFFDRKIRKRTIDTAALYVLRDKILYDIPVDQIINADNLEEISRALETTPYSAIIEKNSETVIRKGSLFLLEIALDHFYYKNLVSTAKKLSDRDKKDALRIIGVEIDLQNINWILRFRRFYDLSLEEVLTLIIPGGYNLGIGLLEEAYTSQNITRILHGIIKTNYPGLSTLLSSQQAESTSELLLIERILERIMIHEIQRILSGYPFTVGIVLSYFILKKIEIIKIKAILNAKQYKISEDRIKGVL